MNATSFFQVIRNWYPQMKANDLHHNIYLADPKQRSTQLIHVNSNLFRRERVKKISKKTWAWHRSSLHVDHMPNLWGLTVHKTMGKPVTTRPCFWLLFFVFGSPLRVFFFSTFSEVKRPTKIRLQNRSGKKNTKASRTKFCHLAGSTKKIQEVDCYLVQVSKISPSFKMSWL